MKLTVLKNGNVRIGFREQIEVKPEGVKEELRKLGESIRQQFSAMLEVYESGYFQTRDLSTILVTDTGITTSATRSPKQAEQPKEAENEANDGPNARAK